MSEKLKTWRRCLNVVSISAFMFYVCSHYGGFDENRLLLVARVTILSIIMATQSIICGAEMMNNGIRGRTIFMMLVSFFLIILQLV